MLARLSFFAVFLLSSLLAGQISATPASNDKIPPPLLPWVEWALHGHDEELHCAPSSTDAAVLHCDWPTQLELQAAEQGGSFRQQWHVLHDRWLILPGNSDQWPQDVKLDGKAAIVVAKNGLPGIRATAGVHTVSGRLPWPSLPEHLSIPAHTGLISLVLNGQPVDFPKVDSDSRLWLQPSRKLAEKIENTLNLRSFRLLDDSIPARLETRLTLDVGGSAREIIIGPAIDTTTSVPLSLVSPLPARLEPDGRIRVQVRPGQWTLTLNSRLNGEVAAWQWQQPDDKAWPTEEILSFQAHPDLRAVDIQGAPAVDPAQTAMPEEWRRLPAFRLASGDTLRLHETRRGAAQPPPDQLNLQRNLWLHFDGKGYTIQDTINGQKNNHWRLEMNPQTRLGRVTINNQEQFITHQPGSDKAGVEVREGQLQLTADSTIDKRDSTLPATGWDHDFQKAGATLHLPPGWRLLHATGVDTASDTWVNRWSLLDFFLVIIFTLAVSRLYGRPTLTIIAFLSYVLSYHEPGAPRWVWVAILIGIALLRHLPTGRFRQTVKGYQALTILSLIVIAIPFTIQQLRTGIYPQLEKPWQNMQSLTERHKTIPPAPVAAPAPMAARQALQQEVLMETAADMAMAPEEQAKGSSSGGGPARAFSKTASMPASYQSRVSQYDPKMIQQTGPGLPQWQWNSISLNWSGPVQRDQRLSLTLVGPTTNLVLACTRILLMGLLAAGLMNMTWKPRQGWTFPNWRTFFLLPFTLLLLCAISPSPTRAESIPDTEMLEQLRERLLEKPDCFPDCAALSAMHLSIRPDTLEITMEVNSQIDTAIPLPGQADQWLPQQVQIDGNPALSLLRSNNQLLTLVPAGRHQIRLHGRMPGQNSIQLPLPLPPHHATTETQGWDVEGIHEGIADNQLLFKRIASEDQSLQVLENGNLPPFVEIERTILLDLNWKVETILRRTTPSGTAIMLDLPLLPGESVITEGIRVENGQARINMDAQSSELRWESVLEKSDTLTLHHPKTDQWTEIWKVDVSPVYHMESKGIPVILHQQGNRWAPTWHPWPGEEVVLQISKPEGIAGQTITIDRSSLQVRPGERATESFLQLSLRSSQGGQHTLTLPPTVQVQKVTINGSIQQIRHENGKLSLPITPGKQDIYLEWREPVGIGTIFRTPLVDLGIPSVNTSIEMTLPPNRWPLWISGPLLGPAILYWSVLIVVVLAAWALARSHLIPLKFYQLVLLGIGMSMSNLFSCLLVAGWLMALHQRQKLNPETGKSTFNLVQTGLAALTLLALMALAWAISRGLLGHPDMNIIGNGSTSHSLRWYQDASGNSMPQGQLFSIPMTAYRIAMLAWALWISFTLLDLLRWGWKIVSVPRLWDTTPKKIKDKKQPMNASSSGDADK